MQAPFRCCICQNPILPDLTGLLVWSVTEPAAFAHTACKGPGLGSRALIERARKEPIGLALDVLLPLTFDALPVQVRALVAELRRVEILTMRGDA